MRNALNKAVKEHKISFNPLAGVDVPEVERDEVTPMEQELCFKVFDMAEKRRLGDIVPLALVTGLRMREIFALEWSAVNLREGVLSLCQPVSGHHEQMMRCQMPLNRLKGEAYIQTHCRVEIRQAG